MGQTIISPILIDSQTLSDDEKTELTFQGEVTELPSIKNFFGKLLK